MRRFFPSSFTHRSRATQSGSGHDLRLRSAEVFECANGTLATLIIIPMLATTALLDPAVAAARQARLTHLLANLDHPMQLMIDLTPLDPEPAADAIRNQASREPHPRLRALQLALATALGQQAQQTSRPVLETILVVTAAATTSTVEPAPALPSALCPPIDAPTHAQAPAARALAGTVPAPAIEAHVASTAPAAPDHLLATRCQQLLTALTRAGLPAQRLQGAALTDRLARWYRPGGPRRPIAAPALEVPDAPTA